MSEAASLAGNTGGGAAGKICPASATATAVADACGERGRDVAVCAGCVATAAVAALEGVRVMRNTTRVPIGAAVFLMLMTCSVAVAVGRTVSFDCTVTCTGGLVGLGSACAGGCTLGRGVLVG